MFNIIRDIIIIGCDNMERKTITIEEIEANPDLDLSERINKFSQDKRWSADDLKELAIASIKQEYEYMANNMSDIPYINEILKQILNGHVFTQEELTEYMSRDLKEVPEIKKYNNLKQKITDNNGITIKDFDELCKTIGFDSKTAELIRVGFESQGKLIDSYKDEEPRHR